MSKSSRPGFTRGGARRWWAAAAAVLSGCLLAAFGWFEQPDPQFRRALASLESRDWERLLYGQLPLARHLGYEPHHALLAGALLLEAKQFEPALRELRHASRHPETRARALLFTGQIRYAEHRFRDAEVCFVNALRLDPTLVDAHRWLAIAYYDIGLMNEAAMQLKQVAELAPDDPRPHRIMALIRMDRGSSAIAVEDLQESLRRDPWQADRQEMLLDLAVAQFSLKRFDEAQVTLAGCEESADVLAVRANCAYALGDLKSARDGAERALQQDPHQRLGVLVLGKLAFDARDYRRAVELLSQAVEAAPTDYPLRYTLMTALRGAGEADRAENELAQVEELRDIQERYDDLIQRATSQPYDADTRYQLGLLAARLKMDRVAESWFKAAVALDPRHRRARIELAKHRADSHDVSTMLLRSGSSTGP